MLHQKQVTMNAQEKTQTLIRMGMASGSGDALSVEKPVRPTGRLNCHSQAASEEQGFRAEVIGWYNAR
jgi:hypothetical protein